MKRTISGIIVSLFLISVLTLTFNIQPIKANLQTSEPGKSFSTDRLQFTHNGTNHNKIRSKKQARIVEHRITTLELEKLKQSAGVWKKGRNYNQIINGHGTGLRSPTEKEWTETSNKTYVVEKILLNQPAESPSSVDHTIGPWFPPIGNQDGEGSCVTWAVGYYVKTFQEAKEHGWDLSGAEWEGGYTGHPSLAYQNRIFSPDFIYNQINDGQDEGSYYSDAINLVCSIGACTWKKTPYNPHDSVTWPSEEAWREAPLYRGNSSGYEYMWLSTDDDLISLKNWIASDHLAVVSIDANQYSNLTSEDFWTLDNYVYPSTNHANTIVGYNDTVEYTEEGQLRHGAFRIANSWGVGGWENVNDGCYWISYETMKQRVGYCMFYRDRIGYDPKLVTSFRMDHLKRGECNIRFGIGNKGAPIQTKRFDDWILDGGNHPFCSNNIVLDITEFEDAVPAVINQPFFMEVYDEGVLAHSGIHEWHSDGVSYSWFRLKQTFDIPETGATLKFWSYYEIEEDWDYGYVEVHDLDTGEWYTLPGLTTVSTLPERQDNPDCPNEFEPTAYFDAGRWNAFTGFSYGWYQEQMDLTPFASHTIELCFSYWTDPYFLELGWCIDDIEIPEVGFFDDVESGPGNWTYNGWYIAAPVTGAISSFAIEYYHSYISDSLRAESASQDVPVNTTDQNYVFAELILTKSIWTVDDDGPADYHVIQEAINAANLGDTIYVKAGTYYEHVVVNKKVSIIGENKDQTFVDGKGTGTVFTIAQDNINITDFTIRNNATDPHAGIILANVNHCNITKNNIIDNDYGVWLYESSNYNSISGNNIRANNYGVSLGLSSNNTLSRNDIVNNTIVGILLSNSSDNDIYGNNMTNNYYGVHLGHSSNNKFYHNNFIDNNWTQAYITTSGYANFWDDGYPSGGNYWNDYNGTDHYSGPHQNLFGSDGIGDVLYDIEADNVDNYPLMKPYCGPCDIGITNITTSKTVVSQGSNLNVTVKILNYGVNAETFIITAYANATVINQTQITLTTRNSTTVTFAWNTTGFTKANYTISAYAWPVPGEIDTADNTLTDGTVTIVHPGDLNNDGVVDIADVILVTAIYRSKCGDPEFRPNSDVIEDCVIDIADVVAVTAHYREKDP